MQQCRVVENTELLVKLRDNIVACLGHMGDATVSPGMPPLPVEPNLELAGKFLPNKVVPQMPSGALPFPLNPEMNMLPPPGAMLPMPGMVGSPPIGMMGMMGPPPPFPMGMMPPPPPPPILIPSSPKVLPSGVPVSEMGGSIVQPSAETPTNGSTPLMLPPVP